MKYLRLAVLFILIATQLSLASDKTDSTSVKVSRDVVLKKLADEHAQLQKNFQYSLTPEQQVMQERAKELAAQYKILSAVKQDSIRVGK